MDFSRGRQWLFLRPLAGGLSLPTKLSLALALAIFITPLLSVPAFATEGQALEVQEYQQDLGVSAQKAERNLEIQRRGAGIVETLKQTMGSQYAGVWFDNESGEFVIGLLPGVERETVSLALTDMNLEEDFRTTAATASWEDLEATQKLVSNAAKDLSHEGLVRTSLDPRTNAVIIHEAVDTKQSDEARLQSLAGDINVERRPTNKQRFNEVEIRSCKTFKPRRCDLPLRGGVEIGALYSSGGGGYTYYGGKCSAGFKAIGNTNGNRFILTAGHCPYLNPADEWGSEFFNEDVHSIGKVENFTFGPTGDWAKIKANGSAWDTPSWPSEVAHYWADQDYPISYEAWTYLGEYVCFSGNKSGTSCGNVASVHQEGLFDTLTKTFLPPLNEVPGICNEGGDSGGPFFSFSSNTGLGLLSAGEGTGCANAIAYYVELVEATSALGVSVGTRIGGPPSAATEAASSIQGRQATANGSINPNQVPTKYRFEYGPTSSYGSVAPVPDGDAGHGGGNVPISTVLTTGLQPATTYHYRLVASNAAGTSYGSDAQFTTLAVPPTVSTGAATSITSRSAMLNGSVNPENSTTQYYFEYGPTISYGTKTAELSAGSGLSAMGVNAPLTGLEFGTQYHFRLVAKNIAGTTYGADRIFTPGWALQASPGLAGAKEDRLKAISCTSQTECTAVGHYEDSAGVTVALAKRWDGTSWEVQSTPNPEGAKRSQLEGVSCRSATECTAVGFYQNASNAYVTLAERWNGTKWEVQSTPNPEGTSHSLLYGISCSSATACTAIGSYTTKPGGFEVERTLAERWNGTKWEVQSTPNPEPAGGNPLSEDSYLKGVSCASATECVATGYHYSSFSGNTFYEALAERWNGTSWQVQATPKPEGKSDTWLEAVSCTSASACTATGYAANGHGAGSIWTTLAERWNGTKWEVQSTPNQEGAINSYLNGVSCSSATDCLAIGTYTNGSGEMPLAERWDGTKWAAQSPANPEAQQRIFLNGVSCTSSIACMASGSYQNSSKYFGSLVEGYFKTPAAAVVTQPATGITTSEAILHGTVNPNDSEAKYYFEYGPTTAYGTKTAELSAGSGTSPIEASKAIAGLEAGTEYHFRIVATNSQSTSLGKDKTFQSGASAVPGQLAGMEITDPFNAGTTAVSDFNTNWSVLGWASGKGEDRTSGWGPSASAAYPAVNGAFYSPTIGDVGAGIAAVATMAVNPALEDRYFSLWLDMPSPTGTRAGYELRFTNTATNTYKATLSKWQGGAQTILATKSNYAFVNGNSLALADQGGTVSVWTDTGSGFGQILGVSDAAFGGGNAGVGGAGAVTRLTNFKVGSLLSPVANMDAALKALALNDSFAKNENPLSGAGAWAALAWDNGSSGHNTGQVSGGWGPYDAYPTINGAFWQKAPFLDTGSGTGVEATLFNNPGLASRYFSLWLNLPTPASTRSGYELRFTEGSAGVYEVALSKWQAGVKTVLASKSSYSFPTSGHFGLADKGGTVSAWTKTGTEYTQLLAAGDSTFAGGYAGIEGSGNIARLKEFRGGTLAPF